MKNISIGDVLGPLIKPRITKKQLVMYSGASGDFNPIHTIDEYAFEAGLGGVVAHGMLTMAFVGQLLDEWIGFDGILQSFGVRFIYMVRPGDVISCYGKVIEIETVDDAQIVKLEVWAETQKGDYVVKGTASVQMLQSDR